MIGPTPNARIARLLLALGGLAAIPPLAVAQQANLKSHEVNADLSVTFRYYAPAARQVTVQLDYDHHPIPLARGAGGVWTLTTAPLGPAVHMYALEADGVPVLDPLNPSVDPNFVYLTNLVRVRGPTPQPWDVTDVPHGVTHHHTYRSGLILGLPDGIEDYYVYTPPGYDAARAKSYPVLYLLHGWSSSADAWLAGGQANLILDNLIAQGRAEPMIVVMPLGYGDFSFVTGVSGQGNNEAAVARNMDLFGRALLTEMIPQVEAAYRVSSAREDRAIAGLSMGGDESLVIGLNHPEVFAWIGAFSSAVNYGRFDGVFPKLGPGAAAPIRLLWVSCGTGDPLIAAHRKFVAWLRTRSVQPAAVETPGIHNWPVWRQDLVSFAPLLFRAPAPR
jgi:enterochelin esterase family protein